MLPHPYQLQPQHLGKFKAIRMFAVFVVLILSYCVFRADIPESSNVFNVSYSLAGTPSKIRTAIDSTHGNKIDSTPIYSNINLSAQSHNSPVKLNGRKLMEKKSGIYHKLVETAILLKESANQMPPLELGMVNVTDNGNSYKIKSGNKHLKVVGIPFSQKDIPAGYTLADVHVYFYQELAHHWLQLNRDSLDVSRSIVFSTTRDDGEYINAIIKAPEAPETAGYTPTTLNDIRLGDPASRIQLIPVPLANNQGSASLGFHIESPRGRESLEPNLTIGYNSDGGNGILGEGWTLNGISSINVDTRWGVPIYDPAKESETYLLDGQMLSQADRNNSLTMAHRDLNISRNTTTTQFISRRESNFSKIERIGTLGDYVWVITDMKGVKSYYGGTINGNVKTIDAVLRSGNKIAEWKLRKIEDQYDNSIEYFYNPSEETLNGNVVKSLNLSKVRYTIYQNNIKLKNVYELTFNYSGRNLNKDFIFNARYGFLSSTNSKTLDSVNITSVDYSSLAGPITTNISNYQFHYSYGAYNKMLLDSISQYGYDGDKEMFFYSQKFTYYSIDSLKGNYFTPTKMRVPTKDFLGKSVTEGRLGFGGAVGIGAPDFQFLSKSLSFDARFSYKENSSEVTMSFVDINGDSKPDILRKEGNRITFRPNTSSFDTITFGPEQTISGISGFSVDDGSSFGVGTEVNGPTGSRVYGGVDLNTANNYTRSYFSDANGDGLLDIVENGEVKFNTYKKGVPGITFTRSSTNTGNPITVSNPIGNDLVREDSTRVAAELRNNITISPLHDIIKIWIAPDSGMIRIDAPVKLLRPIIDPANEDDSIRFKKADNVIVSIQRNSNYIFQPLSIRPGDYAEKSISNVTASVNKGDKILFRVQSGNKETANGDFDQIKWNPKIIYTSKKADLHYFDAFDKNTFSYEALKDYRKVNGSFNLPDSGNYTISGVVRKPKTKDEVKVFIRITGKIVIDSFPDQITVQRLNAVDTVIHFMNYRYRQKDSVLERTLGRAAQVFNMNFPTPQIYGYNTAITFEVTPASNFDLTGIDWKPKIIYDYYDSSEVDAKKRLKRDSTTCYPMLNFRGSVVKSGVYIKVKDSGDVRISPILQLGANRGKVTMIVSDKDSILIKKEYQQSTFLKDTFSFPRDTGQFYTVAYEIDTINNLDTTLATGRIPSYLLMPHDFSNWVVPQTGVYDFFGAGKGSLSRAVLRRNGVDSKPHNRDTLLNIFLQEDDVISFIDTINRNPNPFSIIMTQASAVFARWDQQDYGTLYRGWGQGVFNATSFLGTPIPAELFHLNQLQRNQFYETQFFSMPFDSKTSHYTGVNSRIYLSGDTMSSSRMAMANVQPPPLFIVSGTVNGTGARAVVKYSKTQSVTVAAGAFGVTGNKSINAGTESYSDYIDLNGDRFPDILGRSSVQFTTPLGGLKSDVSFMSPGLQKATTNSFGINLGGVFFEPFVASGKSPGQNSNKASTAGARMSSVLSGLSGGYNNNDDEVEENLYDINGDGLPDKIRKDGSVLLNLGGEFSSNPLSWNFNSIQSSSSHSFSGGGGFNNDNNSISGGVTFATTDVAQANSLLDINGDGLIDKVINSAGGLDFIFNTGKNISGEASQRIHLNNSFGIAQSQSQSIGVNGAYTFAPHIFALFVPVCKIVFSVSSNLGTGNNTTQSQWADINGDGFIDFIKQDGNNVEIMISNMAKINRLRQVSGPLGAAYVIDYNHSDANFDHPGGKWVMASLTVSDGIKDNGNPSISRYEYYDGKYDRYEREFLGFGRVETIELANGKPYRKKIDEYNNDNYFVSNQLAKQWIEDSSGGKYAVKENHYYERMRDRIDRMNNFPPVPPSLLKVSVMQSPIRTHKEYAQEGGTTKILLNQTDYTYDSLLNVKTFSYREGEDPVQRRKSFYITEIVCQALDKASNIYGLPISVVVKNSDGNVIKKVKATYPKSLKGKMQSESIYSDDFTFASTTYDYDGNSGNLIKKTNPDGGVETFEYDRTFETYVTTITDAYKLENNFEYDFRFGLDTKRTLTNGLATKTKYDAFGRIVKIQGPNQTNLDINNADFTMLVEYQHQQQIPYAIVRHYDEEHDADGFYTINFVDGLGRNVQIKKTGVVNGTKQWLINGLKKYDEMQRLQYAYYPITQPYDVTGEMVIGSAGREFVKTIDAIPPTIYEYDVLDRLLSTRNPNNKIFQTNAYLLKKDGFGNLSPVTVTTYTADKKSNKKELFTNGSGLNSTEIYYNDVNNDSVRKITRFSYEPLHKLDSVSNIKRGIPFLILANKYDWAGRRTIYYNISSGVWQYKYDGLNNIIRKVTANNDTIEYSYEHQRLVKRNYSKHPEDSVRYVYADKTNAGNYGVGKVVFQVDATGAQSFAYDAFGNISGNVRTLIAPFDTTYTFAFGYQYDSWGRLLKMSYPSGEDVRYEYDIAGNLNKVTGSKHSTTADDFHYVNNIGYDKFGERISLTYGNELVAKYEYEDTLRRLKRVKTMNNGAEIMSSSYEYDELNNVAQNTNRSKFPGMVPVEMHHDYTYSNQNQIATAKGEWNKRTTYNLSLFYDDQFNIHSRSLDLVSPTVTRSISSTFNYGPGNPLQLEIVQDSIGRTNSATHSAYKEKLTASHLYDANGNDIYMSSADSFQANINERKILWDEESRIRAVSSNGYLSMYTYDADGNRTIKMSGETEGVYVNGQFAGSRTGISTYSVFVNPYFSVRNSRGIATKHIYIGQERIVSKLTSYTAWPSNNDDITIRHPERDTIKLDDKLVAKNRRISVIYDKKRLKTEEIFNSYFDSLMVPHSIIPHNSLTKTWPTLVYPINGDPAKQDDVGKVKTAVDGDENLRYFYHGNYLGNVSFVSDWEGLIVQYVEYLPFGEAFMEQRKNYSSQFSFNAKEQDAETGFYYYGARYYDPQTYQWLAVDPKAEKFPGSSPYSFANQNPLLYIDREGMDAELSYDVGVKSDVVNSYTEDLIRESGEGHINMTSTTRDESRQISAMYRNILRTGAQSQKDTYSNKGDQVIDAYTIASGVPGATPASIQEAMLKKAAEVGFISGHSNPEYSKINVVDVQLPAGRNLGQRENAFIGNIQIAAPRVIVRRENNVLHLEVPIPFLNRYLPNSLLKIFK